MPIFGVGPPLYPATGQPVPQPSPIFDARRLPYPMTAPSVPPVSQGAPLPIFGDGSQAPPRAPYPVSPSANNAPLSPYRVPQQHQSVEPAVNTEQRLNPVPPVPSNFNSGVATSGQVPGAPAFQLASRVPVEEFEPARILAHVDGVPILEGEVLGQVNQVLLPRKDQMPEAELEKARQMLTLRFLKNRIEMKMLYQQFVNTIPEENREKGMAKAWEQVGEMFESQELPKMLKNAKVETPQELDAKYREYGYSLAKHRRGFGEKQLGTYIMLQSVDRRPEVTYDEMIEYYRENEQEYAYKARARWEQLTVLYLNHPRGEAWQLVGQMGDAVFYGTPFAAVARKSSEGYRAADGGLNDWATQGSLASKSLNEAIFNLPLNRLSLRIEDDQGVHILRVLEREPAGKRPFLEAQVEIKRKIQEAKRSKQMKEFLQKVQEKTLITTVFDGQPEGPLLDRE